MGANCCAKRSKDGISTPGGISKPDSGILSIVEL